MSRAALAAAAVAAAAAPASPGAVETFCTELRMTVVTLRAGAPRSARLFLAQIAVAPRRGGIGALLFDRELGYRARVESDRVARLGQQHRP